MTHSGRAGSGCSAIVLAAGAGSRYAAESGRFKLLEPLSDGRPMARAVCESALPSVDEVVLVGHWHRDRLAEALLDLPVRIVSCAAAALGMGASIKCGVAALTQHHAVLILLADMPYVAPATVGAVCQALRDGAGIARPVHAGRLGHPVGFGSWFRGALLSLDDAHGAASLVRANADVLQQVEVDDGGCLHDVDVPADLVARL